MPSVRPSARISAAVLALGVAALAVGPAAAAGEASRGTATALRLGIAGTPLSSGQYVARNAGSGETTSGSNAPALTVLGTQNVVNQGTLHQDAATSASGRTLSSAACAGLSGDGATLVAVGATRCLQQGRDTVSLNAGTLNLSDLDLANAVVTNNGQLNAALTTALGPLAALLAPTGFTTALDNAVTTSLGALGNPGLSLDAGLVQSRCTASPGSLTGSTDLAQAGVAVNFGTAAQQAGFDPVRIALPSDPAPNTKVVTNLDAVTTEITDGLTASLNANAQNGALGTVFQTLGFTTAQVATVVNAVVDRVSAGLQPLQDNVLDITLNAQDRPSADQIDVTALDVQVLPAAGQVIDASLASLQVGDISCLGATRVPADGTTTGGSGSGSGSSSSGSGSSAVPTSVDSGLAGTPSAGSSGVPVVVTTVLGALLLLGGAATGARRWVVRSR